MDDVGGDIDVDMIDIGADFSETRLFVCVMWEKAWCKIWFDYSRQRLGL